jgi:predicted nucleic acid-binding protein
MPDLVFVDTNVLVYKRDASESQKQKQAETWMAHLWHNRIGRISFQVLQEYYVTVTAKLDPGLDPESARGDVRALLAWHPISIDDRVLENAWQVQDGNAISWWDALIVSAAQVAGCRYLLTEDLQEKQVFGNLQVANPFHTIPEALTL